MSKTKNAIELLYKMLSARGIADNVIISIYNDVDEGILTVYGRCYEILVSKDIPAFLILNNISDTERFKSIVEDVYENIIYLIEEESEIDEHWEFLELWCM